MVHTHLRMHVCVSRLNVDSQTVLVYILKIVDARCQITYFHYYYGFDPVLPGTQASSVVEDKLVLLIFLSPQLRC